MSKNWIEKSMLLLTLVGALLSFYLFYTDVFNVPTICPNEGCAVVAASEYSRFIGVHVSLWGLLYYMVLALLFIFKDNFELLARNFNKVVGLFLGVGILFTLYLRLVEFFIIKAICIWCWGSVVIVILLTVLYFLYIRPNEQAPAAN